MEVGVSEMGRGRDGRLGDEGIGRRAWWWVLGRWDVQGLDGEEGRGEIWFWGKRGREYKIGLLCMELEAMRVE